ncbi:MAG: hypothetical protein HDR01_00860 [Lachnospiraceae bacterium]|nr:hypothetical protein [Lachnospiraceae bacterium]
MQLNKYNYQSATENNYEKITLLKSYTFQYIFFFIEAINILFLIIARMDEVLIKFLFICAELLVAFGLVTIFRFSDYKFNRLSKIGVVLKTKIDEKGTYKTFMGDDLSAIRIQSTYVDEEGNRFVFCRDYADIATTFLCSAESIRQERYVNVLVNPNNYKDYYMMVNEIEEIQKNLYANEKYSKGILIILILEYVLYLLFR